MNARIVTILVAGVLLLVVVAGLLYVESWHADRTLALAVQPGMTRGQVVESLGVLYDGFTPGQLDSVDDVISQMENFSSITYVAVWRIAHSRSRLWVGFDADGTVVATEVFPMPRHSTKATGGSNPADG